METVKLSICIPVYNCEQFVKTAIDSVFSQNFSDFELIIVDNQSTDKTVEVIKSINDPRIKFFQNESNIGMLANWNKALSLAKGKYIKLLPADDFLYSGCLKIQCDILDKDKEEKIVLVCGKKNVINDAGKTLFERGYAKTAMQVNGFKAMNKIIRSGGNIIGEPGVVMFRRSILQKSGNFDASIYYVMDLFTWFKMLVHGDLYFTPNIVCAFRISTVSESTKIIDKQRSDVTNFIKKIYNDKRYKISTTNYIIGIFNSYLLSIAKKTIYKLVTK